MYTEEQKDKKLFTSRVLSTLSEEENMKIQGPLDCRKCKRITVRRKEVSGGFRQEYFCPKVGKVIASFGMAEFCHYAEE